MEYVWITRVFFLHFAPRRLGYRFYRNVFSSVYYFTMFHFHFYVRFQIVSEDLLKLLIESVDSSSKWNFRRTSSSDEDNFSWGLDSSISLELFWNVFFLSRLRYSGYHADEEVYILQLDVRNSAYEEYARQHLWRNSIISCFGSRVCTVDKRKIWRRIRSQELSNSIYTKYRNDKVIIKIKTESNMYLSIMTH